MIICTHCASHELDGTIFCNNCGTQLVLSPHTQKLSQQQARPSENINNNLPDPVSTAKIALHLLASKHLIEITEGRPLIIGRYDELQQVQPDIDLTIYNALENGVSRMHAIIQAQKGKIFLQDTNSSNGTFINSIRISPGINHPLQYGDIISFGKLKFQLVFI